MRIILMVFLLVSCHPKPTSIDLMLSQMEAISQRLKLNELGVMADSNFTDTTNLNSIFYCKIITAKGKVKKINVEDAMVQYLTNMKSDDITIYPIFEIKNSSKVILPVFGHGLWDKIWGRILINRKTLIIEKVEFDHIGETPGLGARISESEFEDQFKGKHIYLNSNSFALYRDDKMFREGKQKVDGISGATLTSIGVIEMLHIGLKKYETYLRSEAKFR